MIGTETLKCAKCGQELTFYKNRSDGFRCPICHYPLIEPIGSNIRPRECVIATRELYKKDYKSRPKKSLEEILKDDMQL